MDENEIAEHRYRFFSEKAVAMAMEHDRTLVTLLTAIIAGLVALVVYGPVGFWSGVMFLVAAGSAVLGMAFCLLHMSVSAKALFGMAALFGGEETVPNLVEGGRLTEDVVRENLGFAQTCYTQQLAYLFTSVVCAGAGLAVELWRHVLTMGIVIGIAIVVGLFFLVAFIGWRRASSP